MLKFVRNRIFYSTIKKTSLLSKEEQKLNEEIDFAKHFLETNLKQNVIPKKFYSLSFSRSSGPGGQNVNKLSTKVTLTLNKDFLGSYLPKYVSKQLFSNNFGYLTKEKNKLVIQSDSARSRTANIDDCFFKLEKSISKCIVFQNLETAKEDEIRWKNIKKQTNEYRLQDKKRLKQKKINRGKILDY